MQVDMLRLGTFVKSAQPPARRPHLADLVHRGRFAEQPHRIARNLVEHLPEISEHLVSRSTKLAAGGASRGCDTQASVHTLCGRVRSCMHVRACIRVCVRVCVCMRVCVRVRVHASRPACVRGAHCCCLIACVRASLHARASRMHRGLRECDNNVKTGWTRSVWMRACSENVTM
eukprot:3219562-Pleurochrysis_carterae.AAC.2